MVDARTRTPVLETRIPRKLLSRRQYRQYMAYNTSSPNNYVNKSTINTIMTKRSAIETGLVKRKMPWFQWSLKKHLFTEILLTLLLLHSKHQLYWRWKRTLWPLPSSTLQGLSTPLNQPNLGPKLIEQRANKGKIPVQEILVQKMKRTSVSYRQRLYC